MTVGMTQLIATFGAAALALAAMLWAYRVTEGSRSAANAFRRRSRQLEERTARAESIFGAHPGVVLVWEDDEPEAATLGQPQVYGSPVAFGSLLKFTDESTAMDPAVRLLEGLADLEARDASGQHATLRERLQELRLNGASFSLTIIGPSGRFLEADGRTAGVRAVLWITDSTIKGIEESSARGRFEEARQIVARDPTAFLDMLAKAPFPVWRLSGAGRLQWANSAYLASVGADGLDQAIDGQMRLDEQITEQVRRTIESRADITEQRHLAVNGERRIYRVLTFPLTGGAGAMAFDVTDEEQARETLNRHVKAHDETLNHVDEGVAIFGPDRNLTFYNRAFSEMWSLGESFLSGHPSHSTILDRLREKRKLPTQSNWAEWRAKELGHHQTSRTVPPESWRLPDGRIISVTRQRHPLGGLLILFKDITEDVKLRARFNELTQTQTATLDNLHEAVLVFGADARLKLVNTAFFEQWNIEKAELESRGMDFDKVTSLCKPLFRDEAVWSEIKARVTDPDPRARRESGTFMRRSDDTILKYLTHPLPDGATLIAFVDETANLKMKKVLTDKADAFAAADQLRKRFVENVSYQLRSPLQSIMGFAQFIDGDLAGPINERQRDSVRSILRASTDLQKLIDNILDLAMIEAGRYDLELDTVDLTALIEDSIGLVANSVEDTRTAIRTEIPAGIGTIRADGKRLRQVLFNLLSNAIHNTVAGDEIAVGATREDGIVKLTVRDTGRGIAFDKQASAFDPFQSSEQTGAGVGLTLVRAFIERHNGWVAIDSEPGTGTTVICALPEDATPTLRPHSPPRDEASELRQRTAA